jgi:hypothetical protein
MNPYSQRRYPPNHSNASSTANLIPQAQPPSSIRPQFTRRFSSSKSFPTSSSGSLVRSLSRHDQIGISITPRMRRTPAASLSQNAYVISRNLASHQTHSRPYSSLCHQIQRLGAPTSLRTTRNQTTTSTTLTQSETANMILVDTCSPIAGSLT